MKYRDNRNWWLIGIFLFALTAYGAADKIQWENLVLKSNLSVAGTTTLTGAGTMGGVALLSQTNTVTGITNKTFTVPTLDISIWDDQGSTPANPSSGFYKTYFKSDGKFYKLNSAGTEVEIGSGSGAGGTNDMREYVTNGKFETDVTTGWTTYDDAAAAPVDGTGGTVTTGWTRTTTNGEVLRDTASAELAKDAANRQGEGVCVDVTLDPSDYTTLKGVPVSFEYNTTSAYASADVLVYGIDVSAGTVQAIQTVQSTTAGTVLASSAFTKWNGTYYPTAVANSSYKFCLHIATTNASAWDMHVDSFHIGNQNSIPGAIIADLGTEAWTDAWANATTSVRLTRIGNRLIVDGTTSVTGAGATGFTVTVPATYTAIASAEVLRVGDVMFQDTGVASNSGAVFMTAVNTLTVYVDTAGTTYVSQAQPAAAVPFASWGSGDFIRWQAEWIVSGWSTSAALSTSEILLSNVRVEATRSSSGQTITTGSTDTVVFNTEITDNFSAYNPSTGEFTAPRPGSYFISANFYTATQTAFATNERMIMYIFKNGVQDKVLSVRADGSQSQTGVDGSALVTLVKGDVITVRVFQDSGSSQSTFTSAGYTNLTIHGIPDLSVFAQYNSDRWYINAYQDGANPDLTINAASAYIEMSNAGLTLTPITGSAAVGVMCSSTNAATTPSTSATTCSAGSESLGINFAIPEPGVYEVCIDFAWFAQCDSAETLAATFQLIETPTNAQTLTLESGARTSASLVGGATDSAATYPFTGFCGLFNWSGVSAGTIKGVRLMFEQSNTNTPDSSLILADASSSAGQRNVHWRVRKY